MKEFKFGTYIKKRRKELGISQEDLCEGLCSVSTLSRLENNQQTPSRSLARQLLERLGLPKNRFIVLWDQESLAVGTLVREIRNDIIQCRRVLAADRPKICEQIEKRMLKLEEIIDPNDQSARQFLLSQKALLGEAKGIYSSEEKLSLQLKAIHLTCPKFDPDDFRHGYYSVDEAMLINQIAESYAEVGQRRRAIDVYRQLLLYIEKNYKDLAEYANYFCIVAHNYAIDLTLEKRYVEAIEIAERGRKNCIHNGKLQFLPGFLAIQAECYFFLENSATSEKLYRQAFYTYEAFGDSVNQEVIRREMREHLNIIIPE